MRLRRPGLAVVALVVALLLSACQAAVKVGVDVKENGSGSVTVTAHLDRDAATSYAQYVRTSDLTKAGWTVTGPSAAAGGAVDFTATKPFADIVAAKAVVTELSGPTGPFRDLTIGRHRSIFQTTTTFRGTVDLTCGINCFSDPQLRQALGGATGTGIDPSTLQADAGVILDRLFQFQVAARLPGKVQSSNAPTQVGNGAVWQAKLGQRAVLTATARAWNVTHILMAIVGGMLVLVGAGLVLVKRRRTAVAA